VPAIQLVVPPETVTWLKVPVALTGSSWMSTIVWLSGFLIVTMTAVFAPGAGETVPLTIMLFPETYEAAFV